MIIAIQRQSGLGACTKALGMGIKVYLNGVNYTYYRDKNLRVHHIDELNNINENQLLLLENEDSIYNKKETKKVCGIMQSVRDWESLYNNLLTEKKDASANH